VSLTSQALAKNRTTFTALAIILVGGLSAYRSLPRAEDPGFIIRTAVVITNFPGASPERVELLVTDKIEKAIQEIPELDVIRSQSKTGSSIIWVDIKEEYTEMRPIWDSLRRKVDRVRGDLPEGVSGPFVNDEFGDVFGIVIALTGDGFTYAELKNVADEVRDELLLIPDVAKVDIYGAQDERIFVEYNNARLAEYGISPIQLEQILASRNIVIPGGNITTGDERIVLEPTGNFESVDELKQTIIKLPGRDALIYLQDLAEVSRGYVDPPKTMMRANGIPALGLAVSMREGGNIIALGEAVRATIDRVKASYPIGIEFDYTQFQPDPVQKKVDDFAGSLLQAIAIVGLVMLLTLGLRTGFVVASLIPMAMIMALLVMSFFGIGLDQMSLASLIIALGMLVDNAIVMSESIMVMMQGGKSPVQSAVDSAHELMLPLLTSSLTTAAAFLPIYLAESAVGEYTAPIFLVVTITLLCSWLLALTMIPLLAVRFLRVNPAAGEQDFDTPFYRRYRGLLLAALRRPWHSLAAVLAVFVLALVGFRFIPVIFFPPNDRPTFSADLELPVGTPIEKTAAMVSVFDRFLSASLATGPDRETGITNWAAFIGEGAPRYLLPYAPEMAAPEYSYMILNATSRNIIEDLVAPMEAFANQSFPDLKATIRPLDLGPPAWPPIEVRVSGRDPDVLFHLVDQVKAQLREIPGTKLIDDNWGPRSKKIEVRVNQPRARRAGVTSQDIAVSLQTYLSGIDISEYREEDDVIPITMRSVAAERKDIDQLESLNVYAQATGRSVPLRQVADVQVVWQPAKILRYDRLKTVTVEAATDPGVTANEVTAKLRPWLEKQSQEWGLGYSWAFGGEQESSVKANASIMAKLPIAGLLILLLLVGQFNSFRRPAIILLTIPLGIIGVIFGLLVARSYFGFMTLLGIISLSGIVINNAIVLLDRIKIEIEENGLEPSKAVIEAAQKRLRPILLTTATTVGGLLPLWFGGGPMWEPMAIAIIFGLMFATMLTLGVVPVLYSLFFGVKYSGRGIGGLSGSSS
jgi:multidrug efflux pump subunit AcrB